MPLLDEIASQVEDYGSRPPEFLFNGEPREMVHGFLDWLLGLRQGWASLPETVPHVVLLAWRNGYANHPANATPIPFYRCEGCHMVLPNCTPDGFGDFIRPCPVCNGDRFGVASLSSPTVRFDPIQ
jgi:hypothetical protein